MKALITALLVVGVVWTTQAQEKLRPVATASAVQPNFTMVELFSVMVVVGGLIYLNLYIRWKAAGAPTDSRQIWPPDTNTVASGSIIRPAILADSAPALIGTVEAGDYPVVIHPDITSEGLIDDRGPAPVPFTSAFETVLQEADQLGQFRALYRLRGFVSSNGVLTYLLNSTNGYVAQSYGLTGATLCATNTFPGASIATGQEPQKFYRLAAP